MKAFLLLLALSSFVQSLVVQDTLKSQASSELAPGLPPSLQPELQDDHLPVGDPNDSIQDFDFPIDEKGLEQCPDYDPDQAKDAMTRMMPPRKGTTAMLRSIWPLGTR